MAPAMRSSPMPGPAAEQRVSDDVQPQLLTGFAAALVLVVGLGGWAATAELSGAVIAQGTVVVDSNVRKVQHHSGGIVGEIRVRDGDKVAAGDLLVRLDETITRANLQIVAGQLDELAVRQVRLGAERDGRDTADFSQLLATRADVSALQEIVAAERTLFEGRRLARTGQKAQLKERIDQLTQEIGGVLAQQKAKGREIALIDKELEGLVILQAKNLVPSIKMTTLQREAARLDGERAQLIAAAAQAKGRIAEIELQIIQIEQDVRTEALKDLREVQAKLAELGERRVAAEDQLKRIDIRSPQAGIVHQMSVHTVGGVITPSETIMLVVPAGDVLVIEAKIAPHDIDNVRPGQAAYVRFPAFNQRTTPEFNGEVQRVSADLSKEPQTNLAYFVARITIPEDELARMGVLKLQPGMPAEIHIRTGERTALSYLMKPLTDQFARAFKER